MNRFLALTAAVLAVVAAGLASYAAFHHSDTKTVIREVTVPGGTPTAATATTSGTPESVYAADSKGVVTITVTEGASGSSGFFGGGGTEEAQGTGIVYDSAGDIVTNEHVVDGATSISVQFQNGQTYKAKLVGSDPSTDVAVIRVNVPTSLLDPLQFANSDAVQVGENVVAIGSPYGLQETLTAGIVSALHREMTAPNNFTIPDSIQTDAAINHGNSGGPLLDLSGHVIGINAQIKSDSGENTGVGFAIPSNTVQSIASQLISKGSVQHAYLGVGIASAPNGVELTEVRTGTPAAGAGLETGDIIVRIDGQKITDADALGNAIDAKQPGDHVTLAYMRDGKTHVVTVTLAVRPS